MEKKENKSSLFSVENSTETKNSALFFCFAVPPVKSGAFGYCERGIPREEGRGERNREYRALIALKKRKGQRVQGTTAVWSLLQRVDDTVRAF